jgi:hypothetical protein
VAGEHARWQHQEQRREPDRAGVKERGSEGGGKTRY